MTSPPPSETGATAEARLHRKVGFCKAPAECLGCQEILAFAEQAKRSAHLKDARAGCVGCRRGGPINRSGWVHPIAGDWFPCARPEVWDALSIYPGGADIPSAPDVRPKSKDEPV